MKNKDVLFSCLFFAMLSIIVFGASLFNIAFAGILGLILIVFAGMLMIYLKQLVISKAPATQKERIAYLNFKIEEINLYENLEPVFVVGGVMNLMILLPFLL